MLSNKNSCVCRRLFDPWTVETAVETLLEAGVNPVMDYEEYGKAHGIEAVAVVSEPPVIPPGEFGIDDQNADLGVWHDLVRHSGLVGKAYDNGAIHANDNTYVIYGNGLLELQGIGSNDYESA